MGQQEQAGLPGAVTAVIAAAHSWTSGVESLEGPLEQEVREATDACWSFSVKPLQVGNKFLLQRRNVRVQQAALSPDDEEQQLGGALRQWLAAAEGAVAATGLELRVAESRLLHAAHRALGDDGGGSPQAALAALDALLGAFAAVGPSEHPVALRTRALLQRLALQAGSRHSSSAAGEQPRAAEAQAGCIRVLLKHAAAAPFAACLLQPPAPLLPAALAAILRQEAPAEGADSSSGSSRLQAQALLLRQLPWDASAQLPSEQLSEQLVAPLAGFADSLSREPQPAPPEWRAAAAALLQVLARVAAAAPAATEAPLGLLLAFLTALARGVPLQALLKSVNGSGAGAGLASVDVVEWAQVLWRCPSGQQPAAAQLCQQLPWAALAPLLPGGLRLRALLGLLAALKAGEQGGPFGAWLWRLLEGPAGGLLLGVAGQEQAGDVHALCMLQAPAARPDVGALWAHAQLRLAVALVERCSPEPAAAAAVAGRQLGSDAPVVVCGPEAGTGAAVWGHAEGLFEAMQVWRLFRPLAEAGQARPAAGALLALWRLLAARGAQQAHLAAMARVLGSLLEHLPGQAHSVAAMIREAVTALFEPRAQAEAAGQLPQQPAVPHRQYHAPAQRGSTAYPGARALAAASDWAAILSLCLAAPAGLPLPAAAALSDLTQLLHYHGDGRQLGGSCPEAARELPHKTAEAIVAALGPERGRRTFAKLADAQRAAPQDCAWLPLLACWLADALAEGADAAHLAGGAAGEAGGGANRTADEALTIQAAALALGYHGAAHPLWRQFLRRYLGFQTQVQALVPTQEIAQHLAQLASLYEAQAPALADAYSLWATLAPESLAGDPAAEGEALTALMQLHPLALAPRPPAQQGPAQQQAQPAGAGAGDLRGLAAAAPPADRATLAALAAEQQALDAGLQETRQAMAAWAAAGGQAGAGGEGPALPPEPLARALAGVWGAQAGMLDALEALQGGLRELVQRRYRNVDVRSLEAGDLGEAEEVACTEDPAYASSLAGNRRRALAAVAGFAAGTELAQASALLFQAEAVLFEAGAGGESAAVGALPLVEALVDTILDASSPSTAVPYLTSLFQAAAARALGPPPAELPTRVRLLRRVVSALAGSGAARGTEAAVLLNCVSGGAEPAPPAAVGACFAAVAAALAAPPGVPPAVAANLLACFDARGYASGLMARPEQDSGLRGSGAEEPPAADEPGGPPRHAAALLGLAAALLALPGGLDAGAAVLDGVLAPAGGEDGASASSSGGHGHQLFAAAVAVALPAWQASRQDGVLRPLLRCDLGGLPLPVALDSIAQVTSSIQDNPAAAAGVPHALLQPLVRCPAVVRCLRAAASGSGEAEPEAGAACWTASLSAAGLGQAQERPVALLSAVRGRVDAGEALEALLGACLQAVLEKHGSGLEGTALTQEFDRLLALICEPAAEHPWMVDWLWALYKSHLRPFLALAGDASGGAAVTSFREFWASLPWGQATFHAASPEAVADLGSHVLNADRAVLQLLHGLSWQPVLSQLDSLAAREPLVRRRASRWGTQLGCLALRAHILLRPGELPDWLQAMLRPEAGGRARVPGLPQLARALDPQGLLQLRGVLCSRLGGVPFLLQPLVVSPLLVQADPGERLLHIARLLAAAAAGQGSAQLSALAAAATRTVLLVSVSSEPSAAAGAHAAECWHLSEAQHLEVARECLLPLAREHASTSLAMTARGERPGGQSLLAELGGVSQAGASHWRPPQLSQLAGRAGGGGQHWGDPPAPARSPGRAGGAADAADAALPLAAFLDLLRDDAADVIRTADALPFANAPAPFATLPPPPPPPARQQSRGGSGDLDAHHRDSFLAASVHKFRQKLEGSSPRAKQQQQPPPPPPDGHALQLRLAEMLREACRANASLALCTLRLLLTNSALRRSSVPTALQEALLLDLAQAAAHGDGAAAGAEAAFAGLGEGEAMAVIADACHGSAPLTQAAASLALLRSRPVRELERAAWRLLAGEVVRLAAEGQARADAPSHALALWLVVLAWVGDARWRGTQAGRDAGVLEGFLDSLQAHTAAVRAGARPEQPLPEAAGEERASLVSAAAGRLRGLRSRLLRPEGGFPPDEAPDPAVPSGAISPQAAEALGLQPPPTAAGAGENAGRTLRGLGQGLRKMVGGEQRSRFFGRKGAAAEELPGEEQPPPDSPAAAARERGSGDGLLDRTRERLRRGLAREPRPAQQDGAAAAAAAAAALQAPVALGLAAFAVQAYLKSVLCPSLSDYTPRAALPARASGVGLSSRHSSLGGGLDLQARGPSGAGGMPRPSLSVGSALSTGAVLDEAAMRELDQLMEARTELDALEDLLASPAVAADPHRWAPFFAAIPRLLSAATPVPAFQRELAALLFPACPHLDLGACFAAGGGGGGGTV